MGLFLYDVFWVFGSKSFTSDGVSVMEKVASKSSSGESMPALLVFPSLFNEIPSFSFLGFGDIALPGLFLIYLKVYEYLKLDGKGRLFLSGMMGYVVGMLMTILALLLFETGQPALLYLVPCMLIAVIIRAFYIGELKNMWDSDDLYVKMDLDETLTLTNKMKE
ncbi:peptidase A22B, signal peptide peptidase [Rozella allomycis CSF55]|uniref:Peptidase A22B, signal peptide peptidase n=1 Tax=Rozella allomycis (strain CSF55) TaxID=988480 RepID=A0A075ATR8_ROZAC|nr:Peptidase A22B, signal peptide peptidase domain-containing protein [Rozella allomycis CSF55]RKP18522.1 peptidase A22B, signal peptide peptidase [Rozella allomycis CSF55]|eukprot:EPZ33686.1 Peptidase A22B, signal peptide peptidase domain-containing protein [Rozella allomycis CSF55]